MSSSLDWGEDLSEGGMQRNILLGISIAEAIFTEDHSFLYGMALVHETISISTHLQDSRGKGT